MAKLYITEYQFLGAQSYSGALMPRDGNATIHQTQVTFPGVSEAFAPTTTYIEIWADADCLYAVGPAPDASTGGTPLTAKTSKLVGVRAGNKISVVALS